MPLSRTGSAVAAWAGGGGAAPGRLGLSVVFRAILSLPPCD
jgi:hypothetical protein